MRKEFLFKYSFLIILIVVLFSSCSDFQKALKSKDHAMKFEKAKQYYEKEDWYRAEALLNDVMPIYRGTEQAREMNLMYAYCQYNLGENIVAVYYFKNYSRTWTNTPETEEADFMVAQCLYEESPRYNLDQSNTLKAIESMQYFINMYPLSSRIDSITVLQGLLKKRLEKKSFFDSKQYYMLQNYKSAVISLRNTLRDFPDTEHREEIMFLILKSNYLLARNSIEELRMERLQETINEYYAYIDEFPTSPRSKEAEKIYASCVKAIKRQ
ncbi:MAG: outer membrane protein assembly factor BamD [Bacteroidales bacterium]|jgi:outer membrane protein assembly factor BamD|nr:outer membrane protein assembly factor BamD [Bacteroidales bacterium]